MSLPLSTEQRSVVVGAIKHLADALNTFDPFHVLMAYERIEDIALAERKENEGEPDENR